MAEAKTLQKVKKKRWYPIHAKLFNDRLLGESLASEADELLGRAVNANIASITGDVKQQSVTLRFRINSVKDNKAYADVIGYVLSGTAIKRLVRRNLKRIDDSLVCETEDHVKLRIKIFLLTRSTTSSKVMNALHKLANESIIKRVAKLKYSEFVKVLIEHKLQSDLKRVLSEIYPLRAFEIKMFELIAKEKAAKAIAKEQMADEIAE
jgi:ribosomal protein S3AE